MVSPTYERSRAFTVVFRPTVLASAVRHPRTVKAECLAQFAQWIARNVERCEMRAGESGGENRSSGGRKRAAREASVSATLPHRRRQ